MRSHSEVASGRWKEYIAIILITSAAYSGLFTMPLWVGGLTDDLGLSPSIPGYMGSLQLACAVVASLWASVNINRYRLSRIAMVGLLGIIIANVLSSIVQSVPLLFACRGLSGVGEGLLLAVLNGAISRTWNPEKNFAISQTAIAFFGIVLFSTAPGLMSIFGVSAVFLCVVCVALLPLINLTFTSTLLDRVAPSSQSGRPSSSASTRCWAPLVALAILFIGCQGGWVYMERMGVAKGFDLQSVGWFLVLGQVFSLFAPFSATKLMGRAGYHIAISVGVVISGGAIMAASQNGPEALYPVALSIFQFGTLFIVTSYFCYLSHVDATGKSVAAAPAFINVGSAVGPMAMAFALNAGGFSLVGWVAIATYILCLSILLFGLRLGKSQLVEINES